MAQLVWDRVEDRIFESGLDRGVLYLPDGSAVPWSGLTSVIESFNKETSAVYYDGVKINDLVTLGDFAATLKAVTYPDEFNELEGLGVVRRGLFVGDQSPKAFGLCYRVQVNDSLNQDKNRYKIHILYNVIAIPNDRTAASQNANPSLVEFEWKLSAVPEEFPGFRPTAHLIIDTEKVDPDLLIQIENQIYGHLGGDAALLPMADMVTMINGWFRVKIVDNGDGTWTATSNREGFIQMLSADEFEIANVNAIYTDDATYQISDTIDAADVPEIKVYINEDGTWTATTSHDNLILMTDPNTFEIRDANAVFLDPETYQLSDTEG